jgi:hypothetical protein
MLDFIKDGRAIAYRESYFTAKNPTFGTAIAINADPTAIAATEAMAVLYNGADPETQGSVWMIPDFLRLTCRVAPASSTDFRLRFATDKINRLSSGGTTLVSKSVSVGRNLTDRTPYTVATFGDVTTAAASSEKEIDNIQLTGIASATALTPGDVLTIHFGGGGISGGTVGIKTATEGHYHFNVAPMFIGAGCSLLIQPFATSAASTAAQFEVCLGYYEQGHGRFNAA